MGKKYSRYEYAKTVTFTRTTANNAYKAQRDFLDFWAGQTSKAQFTSKLASFATTVIEGIFNRTVYTALPGLVVTALADANAVEQDAVEYVGKKGLRELTDLNSIFVDNKNYSAITFRVNYLAFKNLATGKTDYTIIQGNIVPTKIITTGGGTIPM